MEKIVDIPEGVTITLDEKSGLLAVKGSKGELSRTFKDPKVTLAYKDNKVTITSTAERRKYLALTGTWAAHVRNMIIGVSQGWETTLKVVYSHFPVKVSVKDDKVVISNFLGAKSDRYATIVGQTKVDVKKDELHVSGSNKEEVGQTAGNIELAAKVKNFDRRIFQDGCYITGKCQPSEAGA